MAESRVERRPTVGVVGTGNMGGALVKGWLRPDEAVVDLVVWDKVEAATQRLPASERLAVAASLDDLIARSDVVLVVVKPKDADEVFEAIADRTASVQTVISSMAGLMIERMRAALSLIHI